MPAISRRRLIEQFRIGAYATNPPFRFRRVSPWLIEVVAGIVEAGESPEAVARRENGPLYKLSTNMVFGMGFAATSLGVARATLEGNPPPDPAPPRRSPFELPLQ